MIPFDWKLPTHIHFGAGKRHELVPLLRGMGKRAYIVTSKSFDPISGKKRASIEPLTKALDELGVAWECFSAIEPNPRTLSIDEAATQARAFKPRFVIAFGGGSVMDAAKCVALLLENSGEIYDYCYRGAKSISGHKKKAFNSAAALVCIPTIAATSSETDSYAVVTHWQEHRKVLVFGEALVPKLTIIDPELTYSVSAKQTVDGAFDMITHVMETYLSTAQTSYFQDRLSEAVVKSVIYALQRVLKKADDAEGRAILSWAGALALSGIFSGREGGWPIHAVEHGISAWTDMAHGRGLAMLLPRVMQVDAGKIGEKINAFNRAVFDAEDLNSGLIAFMKEVGAWTTWASEKVADAISPESRAEFFAKIADHALEIDGVWAKGKAPFLENVVRFERAEIIALLEDCFE